MIIRVAAANASGAILEGLLAIYFLCGIIGGFYLPSNPFFIFHVMLMVGYGTICFYSVRHLSYK